MLAAVVVALTACSSVPASDDAAQASASARLETATSAPGSHSAIPGAFEEELPAVDLSEEEVSDLFRAGSGLGISVDEFVTAWNADDEVQPEDEVGRYFNLRIENLALEPVRSRGFAVTQYALGDDSGLVLVTDADQVLHSAALVRERRPTGDPVRDGVANLEHSFAQRYFVSAVNPRLDEFERNHLVADMMDLDEFGADANDGLSTDSSAPVREMIVVKGVRYDVARDDAGVLYLVATGE